MRLEKYNLPDDWEWAKIGDFAKLIRGVSYKKDDASKDSKIGYLPILRANNINNNLIFDDLVYVPSERVKKEQIIHSGDILISMSSGSKHLVGKTAQAYGDYQGSFGAFCGLIRINGEVNKKFINFFFKSQNYRRIISHLSKGININNLRREYIESMPIPLPPFEAQKKIVEILEKAEKLKEWRAEADELADEYLKSVFLEMFGDPALNPKNFPVKELKNFYSNKKPGTKCGPFGSALKKNEYVDSGVPVWIMDNIVNNHFIEEGCLYITEEKFNQLNSYSVDEGDIIISRAGTVGKMCIVTPSTLKSIISTNLIRLSLDDSKILPIYFTFLMTHFKERIGNLKTGSDGSYTFMNTKVLDGLKIVIPPITLQNQFAQIVQQIETLKSYQSHSKQEINNLFNTLMQKAFKGELIC